MRRLLLATIKADIKSRVTASQTKVDDACEKPLHSHDTREAEEELWRELEEVVNATTLKRQQRTDEESQSGDETEEEEEKEGKKREERPVVVNDDDDRESGEDELDWGQDPDV